MTTALVLLALALVAPTLGAHLPYIIGGEDVGSATTYPWQGSLQYFGSHSCGCALISDTWVVTAGHCVGSFKGAYAIRVGTTKWRSGGQLVKPISITRHESYGKGKGSFPNDIAVINIPKVTTSNTVKPITIISGDPAGNSDCYITGWGLTKTGNRGDIPEGLKEANIEVYTNDECSNSWGDGIYPGHVCVGDVSNRRGSCNGDSGGPLVCKVDGSYQLVGVTSWGVNGCYTFLPSVYTRMTYFRRWITENTGV